MPYIEKESRKNVDPAINILSEEISSVGKLNYCITKLCSKILKKSNIRYLTLNEIIGVLECAKLEFYRKMLVPYENHKCSENGDVYIDEEL